MRTRPLVLLVVLYGLLSGMACAGPDQGRKPTWIDGESLQFPRRHYLLGFGQAEARTVAEERAYGAVARVFSATVSQEAKDWESYILLENRGRVEESRKLTIAQMTSVSTDKVLEDVAILDSWLDSDAGIHYVLAGINRRKASTSVLEQITEFDGTVAMELEASRHTQDVLATLRHLKRAASNLVMREAQNADLRVIRSSGQGVSSPYRVPDLIGSIEDFLANNLEVSVIVRGDEADATRRTVIEGLVKYGLPVLDHPLEAHKNEDSVPGRPLQLLVQGSVRVWNLAVADPRFYYVRWCSDFAILDQATHRVVGAVSNTGREGHLTYQAARGKAIRVMQETITTHLSRSLANYVYGGGTPLTEEPGTACPS